MVKFTSSLVLGALLGALASAQPVALQARNYELVNPAPAPVVTVTKTVTVTVAGPQPTGKPDYVAVPVPQPPAPAPAPAPAPQPERQYGAWQQEMLNAVNAIRRSAGKAPVKIDSRLQSIAQAHSQEQNARNLMTHQDSHGSLGQRYNAAGFNWRGAAENIAWNQKSVADVVRTWKNSPGHYANMVGNYNWVGFGEQERYWTQNFLLV
ncbi:hypothetical protein IWQ56_000563 [Coemansia nantahalensis]|uniref:Uncharacterized protein n=2 Tax=Coemansia TaxID=4863 RepID=A0ACC1LAH4_9FUNG|nr:hypothetical protein IWQ56_000563 [Coemansia nantahalensis]KAJ2775689.1 hypothetical protein IWQ57_000259 [Coemansia nantahalensis]KAJ2803992.1 hypothetical protein H4R21_001816 [Coemansia helicoidea]